MKDFDKRLKTKTDPFFAQNGDSSDEEIVGKPGGNTTAPRLTSEVDILKEKNRILMEKLFKSDKQLSDYKDLLETVSGKTQ
jgi:hypothetical protein